MISACLTTLRQAEAFAPKNSINNLTKLDHEKKIRSMMLKKSLCQYHAPFEQ